MAKPVKNTESIISGGRYSQQSNFYLKKAILYSLKNPLNFVILPATHKQGNVTLMFYMKLLVNYCFDTRHAIIMSSHSNPTLGKFSYGWILDSKSGKFTYSWISLYGVRLCLEARYASQRRYGKVLKRREEANGTIDSNCFTIRWPVFI